MPIIRSRLVTKLSTVTSNQTKPRLITSHDEAQQMHSRKNIGDTTIPRSYTDITHFQQSLPNMRSERIAISATATATTTTVTTTFSV
jgi:hypothetical protein